MVLNHCHPSRNLYWHAEQHVCVAAANLVHKLCSILRQDIEFFDEEKNSTGALTASLSGNPRKANGLAGVTLGAIVQSISTIVGDAIIGLTYPRRVALVGLACMSFLVSVGFILLRIVVLNDQKNKKAREDSARVNRDVAGAGVGRRKRGGC